MSRGEQRLLGAGAALMAACCTLLPLVGAAVGGGLVAGARLVGAIAGAVVLGAVGVVAWRRRRERC